MKKYTKLLRSKLVYLLVVLTMILQPVSAPGILKAIAADENTVASAEADSAPKEEVKEESKPETKVEAPAPVAESIPIEEPAPVEVTIETSAVDEAVSEEATDSQNTTSTDSVENVETPEEGIITPEAASIEASIETATEESSDENKPAEEVKKEIWSEDGDKATTNDPVEKDVKYVAPQNEDVTVTFTKLPDNPGKLSIEEIILTDEQVASLNSISNKAYDITSTMEDGSFEYDLTLPKPKDEINVEVRYAEDVDQLDNTSVVSEKDTEINDDSVSASLDHFTVFVVVANDTITDNSVGSEDNGWVADNNYATFDSSSDYADYGFPDITVPAGSTVDGIEVLIEGKTTGRNLTAAIWNTSNSSPDAYTSSKVASLSGSDTTQTLGGQTDKWGKTWTPADFADATFKVRIGATTGGGVASLDQVQVKVYYTEPLLPELIVTKTNNVSGSVLEGNSFIWTLTVINNGTASAVFNDSGINDDDEILHDNLPGIGINYSNFTSSSSGTTGTLDCVLSGNDIDCDAGGGTFTMPPGSSVTVTVTATPTTSGTKANPRSGGICRVDPETDINESNEANNNCSNTVTVIEPGSIDAFKFNDENGNGSWNLGEPGMNDWQMNLYAGYGCSGSPIQQENTDGVYDAEFYNLAPGNYSISETQKDGWEGKTAACVNTNITSGDHDHVYFGNQQRGSIRVCKMILDTNGNIVDGSVLSGDTFTITWNNSGTNLADTVFTSGTALSTKLLESSEGNDAYCVTYDDLAIQSYEYSQENLSNSIDWATPKYNDQYTGATSDLDDFYVYGTNEDSNGEINLNLSPTSPNRTLVILNQYLVGSIEGNKFNDLDGDGSRDDGEPGIYSWQINLFEQTDGGWNKLPHQITDESGHYKFSPLRFGNYVVCENKNSDWAQTYPDANKGIINPTGDTNQEDYCYQITIDESANEYSEVDFGNWQSGKITVIKTTEKDTDRTFPFTSDFAEDFSLGQNGSWTSDFLAPGTYTVSEGPVSGERWSFKSLSCVDSTGLATFVQNKKQVAINLVGGSNVVCTYYNDYSRDDDDGDGDGNGGVETGLTTTGGGTTGGGTTEGTTGGGVVGSGEVEGEEGATSEVAGAETGCNEWPLWVWILILAGYTGIFNALSFYKLKERKDFRWFWQAALTAGAFLLWVYYDKCDWYLWFPYAGAVLGGASYGYYYYMLKKLLAAGVDQIKMG
jgi:hypothetical protein